jgi:hypothetical protein
MITSLLQFQFTSNAKMVGGVQSAVIKRRFGENVLAVTHSQVLAEKYVVQRTLPSSQGAVDPQVD